MFSNDIVGSDSFLEMPSTSQTLYFHLGMRCDDDGFVNPNVTMRMTGANKNDLDILIAKRFLLSFSNGVVVIKHNRINNNWDSRDSKRTLYTEEFSQLFLKENKAYTFDEKQGVPVVEVYQRVTPSGSRRVNAGRIEEKRIEENRREEKRIEEIESGEEYHEEAPNVATPKMISSKFFKGVRDLKKSQEDEIEVITEEGLAVKSFLQDQQKKYPLAPKALLWIEINKFERYWTEKNSTGKKELWQMQKTFEIERRLVTWFGKIKEFKNDTKIESRYQAGKVMLKKHE